MVNNMKKWMVYVCMLALLCGCSMTNTEDHSKKETESEQSTVVIMETETEYIPVIANVDALDAGTRVLPEDIEGGNLDDYFKSYAIDDALFDRIYGLSYKEYCDMIREISIVGGIMIFALGINMLGIKKIRTANMLPALLIPVIYYLPFVQNIIASISNLI